MKERKRAFLCFNIFNGACTPHLEQDPQFLCVLGAADDIAGSAHELPHFLYNVSGSPLPWG